MELDPTKFNKVSIVRHLDLNKILKEYFSDDEKFKKGDSKKNKRNNKK